MKQKQHKILGEVLAQVMREGWTMRAIERAGAAKTFPQVEDAVAAFEAMIDEDVQAKVKAKRNFSAMRVRDKVAFAVRARLEAMEPYRDAARRLAVWFLMPRHIVDGAKHLWKTADAIWLAAGDESTDYNYYTKRALLIAVMKAAFAFWLADESKGRQESWDFLDRRIEDVMRVGKGMSVIKTVGIEDIVSFVKTRLAA
ncbi:MAG: COQ9 family protein [Alphaproteobacteria bacterium]|nr:COQ9 family protein [Alphaproteobacteria bacterium]